MVLENTSAMTDDAALFKAKERGRSSGVERNLAKVEVVGSNPIARSIFLLSLDCLAFSGPPFGPGQVIRRDH